jgi:hypothetical protein
MPHELFDSSTNSDGHVLLRVKTGRGWNWEPMIALKAA